MLLKSVSWQCNETMLRVVRRARRAVQLAGTVLKWGLPGHWSSG